MVFHHWNWIISNLVFFVRGGDYFVLGGSGKKARKNAGHQGFSSSFGKPAVMGILQIPQKTQRNTMPYSVIQTLKFIESDDGKKLTGKPDQFDGKIYGFRLRFSRTNQSNDLNTPETILSWLPQMGIRNPQYPKLAGWFISWKTRKNNMDENWG